VRWLISTVGAIGMVGASRRLAAVRLAGEFGLAGGGGRQTRVPAGRARGAVVGPGLVASPAGRRGLNSISRTADGHVSQSRNFRGGLVLVITSCSCIRSGGATLQKKNSIVSGSYTTPYDSVFHLHLKVSYFDV
jgi:hypothetical protein